MAGVDSPDTVVAARELIVAGAVYEMSRGMVDSPKKLLCPGPRHPRAQGIERTADSTSCYLSAMRKARRDLRSVSSCGRTHCSSAYPCASKEHDESPRHRHAIMVQAPEVAAILLTLSVPVFGDNTHPLFIFTCSWDRKKVLRQCDVFVVSS